MTVTGSTMPNVTPAVAVLAPVRGVALDLDGCVWAGAALLPGAEELVDRLRRTGRRVVFVTNSSRARAADIAARLSRLGIPTAADDVLAALDLLGVAIRRQMGPVRVLGLGAGPMRETLEAAGHTAVGLDEWACAQAVAIGHDPAFDYGRLRAASRAVAAGAAFFAVNLDPRLPVGPGEFEPGCGALAEAVAVAGGARPVVVGKPHRPIFDLALERLGCRADEAAMVGDSLAADIAGGRAAGMVTVWVAPDAEAADRAGADLAVPSLAALAGLLTDRPH